MAGESVESADSVRARITARGQGHVFRFWDRLSEVEREALIEDLRHVPEDFPDSVLAPAPALDPPEPPEVIPAAGSAEERRRATEARALGSHTLSTGAIAAVMLAGGEGTRLGHAGPKGTLPIGPATGKSLYRWFAEQVRFRSRKAGRPLPLVVLTSPSTHVATVEHFRAGGNFGLEGSQVRFVPQGTLPVLDKDGRFVLRSMSSLTKSPDGHGGLLGALKRAGLLAEFRTRGVYHLFVFQVDNPLAKVLDPETIGRHLISGAQASSRVVEKLRPDEPHGVFCRRGGRLHVLEYSEITKEQAERRDADGKLSFRAANIAVHLFRCDFLGQLASDAQALPWHVAEKPARAADSDGKADAVEVAARRAEKFLFDVLPRADRTLLLDGVRDEW
ncbi:MAG: UTP--glucose-1-phosphate uridylyltransferase, partial [Planctomycetales bacterium]|nr:UTP--glucose-1-phosphate uridylyltransferase [Planctomycetales bacterium]